MNKSVARGAQMPELLREETLAAVFAETVRKHGYRPALIDDGGVLSYAELDQEARRLAAGLRARGARPGAFVGLWMPRGRDVVVAQIAIALTGAAWLPFDADAPAARVSAGLADMNAIGIVTPEKWAGLLEGNVPHWDYAALANGPTFDGEGEAGSVDPAYVIYTSGSTGTPKGILVPNRAICHFLRAAEVQYGLRADDVMLQAGSVAFDLSLEEIWLPLLVGAALRICPAEILADPDRLVTLIRDSGVTAMDVVPTLLGLIDDDLPGVRLIIVGGEVCPEAVVNRFATGGRRLVNSYGPSETTVVATATDLKPGEPVTIGRPLPNMSVYVVDDALNLLDRGATGELLIGGPGVAQGYVNRPDLTAEKFIFNPFAHDDGDPVLYRSGDAVEMTADGDLLFRGRVDDQVKLRGFRIELGEIETRLAREPGVAQAAVVVNHTMGIDQLVGYVVMAVGREPDVAAWKASLGVQLPPYMVPAAIETIDALPRLAASGKIDRNTLAARPITSPVPVGEGAAPETETQARLLELGRPLFPGQPLSLDADFFLDLGGHSLLAAQFVSAVRREPGLAAITLGQVYEGRSLRGIAGLIDAAGHSVAGIVEPRERASVWRRYLCGMGQLAAMPLLLLMQSAPWLAIFISYTLISPDDSRFISDLWLVFAAYGGVNLALALFAVAAKWLLLGRTRPGRYPLWGSYFYRVWLVQRMLSLVHLKWMQNSPILPLYLRALGARVGKDVLISDFDAGAIDLISFGDHVATGSKVVFANARITGAWMEIESIEIGRDAAIGSSCTIEGGTTIGEGAELADLAALAAGTRVPAGEVWDGSPAKKTGLADPAALSTPPPQTVAGRMLRGIAYLAMLVFLPAVTILPIVPAFRLMEWLDSFINPLLGISYLWYMPVLALSAGAGMIALTLLMIVACRWLVLPRVRPGRYPIASWFYLRRWALGLLIETALDTLSSLYATVYMRNWYRLMGCRIGKGSEVSTNFAGRFELITLGAGNFIADDVVLGDDHMRHGWLVLDTVKTGDQVFIGNEAVVPQGYTIDDGALIGVRSKPPGGGLVAVGETWFGSPPIRLPVRQTFNHDVRQTFEPSRAMQLGRAAFEAFNISFPTALFITLVTVVMEILTPVFDQANWGRALWICVIASTMIGVVQLFVGAAYKWLMMGRYQPTMKPMWSWWALRTEAVAVMYWAMAGKALLDLLRGTPFLPVALRLFGTRTGTGAYLDSADITEFDCVTIGDDVVLNNHACLQTHLYEDRLMKVGRIAVGDGAVIGAGSTVLYDTSIGSNATLGPLTLIMKGEGIPDGSRFVGSPAQVDRTLLQVAG
ncbi:MAG: amino acid adenylation domain-containing protein [Sphingomonadales bacterium]|nr:amino acid adenylation domain-containing protein [Sphingomonadales bacterium]